ncbi:EAL domain-containing protein [bacterium]|nr:EAL domain-containing protein [bacterium]MBU1957501.1 EAL domain-containing protein [bacterium]
MKSLIYYIAEKVHSPNVKHQITKELYAFTPKMLLSTLMLAGIFLFLFWSQIQNTPLLIAWFLALILLNINRYYDYHHYKKDEESNVTKWYNFFKIKATMNSFLWGITPILFFTDLNHTYQIIMILFIIGLAGGVSGFILDFRISFIFITVLLFPLFMMLFFSSMHHAYVGQLLILMFYFLLFLANKHLNQLFHETYTNQERYHWARDMLSVKEKKLSALLEQAPIGIFYYDQALKIMSFNTMCYKIFGLEANLNEFDLHYLEDKNVVRVLQNVLKDPTLKEEMGSYHISFQEKKIWVNLTCSALVDEHNKIIGGIGTIEDKTIEHEAYRQINHISLHDMLTGLPNRRSYQEYMSELINNDEHHAHHSILFYMDLNHFKQINDTFGHTVGDKLLLEVAKRLKSLKILNKYLSRIGGDEFIMIVPYIEKSISVTKDRAQSIALEIKKLFKPAFEIEGLDLYMTSSIGIVLVEPKSNNTEQIIRQADMAMYQTKREGLNNIRFYDHSLDLKQQRLTSLQHDLKDAIKRNELELYYQPIVHIENNRLNAIEALIRWNHPTKGIILPNLFLPMATESGLITKIGWWVAQEVCKQLSIWQNSKFNSFEYISININARQLNEINFVEQLNTCITNGSIKPSLLKLELTETTLLDNFSKTQNIIKRLKNIGVECSIDDFGTGYSSLSYLKKFAFKVLKIDKVFTKDILTNPENQELIKSIISIGKQFNYKIIIEGVETESQRNKIMEIDKNVYYQGYLYSKAVSAKEFEEKFLL